MSDKIIDAKSAEKKASVAKGASDSPVEEKVTGKAKDKKLSAKEKKASDDLKERAAQAKKRAQEKILEKAYVSDPPSDPLERLANTFDNSARRWEMVVYPSMFAFVLLAGYGFFLIYRLTHDISTLSQSVTRMAVIVSDAMPRMAKDMKVMTGSMDHMSGDIGGMTTEITSMSGQMNSLTPMSNNIQSMTHNIGSMNRSVYGLQRDMSGLNRTVSSGPFGMMNDVMPFSSNTNVPPQMAAPRVWPSYSNVPMQRPAQRPTQQQGQRPAQPAKQQSQKQSSKKPLSTAQKKASSEKPVVPTLNSKQNIKTEVTLPGAAPVIIK